MLKSHQRGDLTPAETKVDYLRFAKVLYEERNGFKRFGAANGSTLLSRSYKNESVRGKTTLLNIIIRMTMYFSLISNQGLNFKFQPQFHELQFCQVNHVTSFVHQVLVIIIKK